MKKYSLLAVFMGMLLITVGCSQSAKTTNTTTNAATNTTNVTSNTNAAVNSAKDDEEEITNDDKEDEDAMMENEDSKEDDAMMEEEGDDAMEADETGDEEESASEEAMTTGEITIDDFDYTPGTLTVAAGATVTVTNNDTVSHSVTADDGSFDTDLLATGESTTFTAPSEPGEYSYFCSVHPSMTGTLVVE